MGGRTSRPKRSGSRGVHPVNRDVADPGIGVLRDEDAGGNIGAAVEFVVGGQGENFLNVDFFRDDVVEKWRFGDHVGFDLDFLSSLNFTKQFPGRHSHGVGIPFPLTRDVGDDVHRRAVGLLEQEGGLSVRFL